MITKLDTNGLLCPLPVLKARKTLSKLAQGDILHVFATDPAAIVDMPHYCAESGHILLDIEEQSDGVTLYKIEKN
ncbi:MAG: sulfurtransferase TusA family protein [Rhodobacteraceae bacterium]|jgi:tRNA 2-thiouridine synthesizing protein A|nr:sulfurtransferase TusA family protein [Paracoccaceae bacterium]